MATVAIGERVLGYERTGEGPPMVVLNGFAATRADWDPGFIAELVATHELVCVDNRGMGESTADGEPFTIEDLAGDVAVVIETLELDRPKVLGWSMGGFIALALALARPDLAGSLILLSTSAGGDDSPLGSDDVRARLSDLSGTPREQATRLISLLFPAERALDIDARFGDVVAAARAEIDHGVAETQWHSIGEWHAQGASGRLGEIGCPALVAAGDEDVVVPPENALVLASGIAGAWLARFPRCGHGFMADHPVALTQLVDAFDAAHG